MLFDPMIQNNDVRMHSYSFHQYADNPTIAQDPIVKELRYLTTPGVNLLYRAIVPLSNVQVANKIVQGITLAVVLLSIIYFSSLSKDSLPSAALLMFLTLHTPSLMASIAGGMQRSFALPSMMLWITGAMAPRRLLRVVGIFIAALTYPVAMALLMAAEFYLIFAGVNWSDSAQRRKQIVLGVKRYSAVLLGCLVLLGPRLSVMIEAGPIHSVHEALQEPAFGPEGRIKVPPFSNPISKMTRRFVSPLVAAGRTVFLRFEVKNTELFTLILVLAISFCVWRKILPVPKVALCLIAASLSMYLVARVFAFDLYLPKRYYQYGLPLACITAFSEIMHQMTGLKLRSYHVPKHFVVSAVVVTLLAIGGNGIQPRLGSYLDGRTHFALFEYFKSTPLNSRIAAHPYDGDDVPYWSGRPTTGGYESLQPWYIDSWRRQKAFTKELLGALYATDWETLISFCRKHNITHLLLRTDRYGNDFRSKATLFQPFGSFLQRILSPIELNDLVITKVIESEPVFRDGSFVVIEVESLLSHASKEEK